MFTLVGIITNTHGIKGNVKVFPYTFDVSRFEEYGQVYLGENKELVTIDKVSYFKNLVILEFKEYSDINDVMKFKDSRIYIKSEDEAKLPDGNYYLSDILGCSVYDKSGKYLGTVTDIVQGASNDVYVVESENLRGSLPAVKEFIVNVDIGKKEIIVSPIKGMFNEVWYIDTLSRIYRLN